MVQGTSNLNSHRFQMSNLQIFNNERLIVLGRHDPSAFENEARTNYSRRRYMLTGQTGSGKSTFGLVKFFDTFRDKRILFIQPTRANVENIRQEWARKIIPRLAVTQPQLRPRQPVVVPLAYRVHVNDIVLATAEDCVEYLVKHGELHRSFDWVLLDEQHQRTQPIVTIRSYLRSTLFTKNYVMISATPDGQVLGSSVPPNVKVYTVNAAPESAFFNDDFWANSDLNPEKHLKSATSDPYNVVVVAPTKAFEDILMTRLAAHSPLLISKDTTAIGYSQILRKLGYGRNIVVITPDVEAGITLVPMHVFIDPAETSSTVMDDSVLYQTVRGLTSDERMQRLGRCGRDDRLLTLAYVNGAHAKPLATDVEDYLAANAYILLISLGIPSSTFRHTSAARKFVRLAVMTQDCAKAAVAKNALEPLLPSYTFADSGLLFLACGGVATGFADAAKRDLRIFKANGGSVNTAPSNVVLPIFALNDVDFDPYAFVAPEHQDDVLKAIARDEARRLSTMTVAERTDILVDRIDEFADLVIRAIRQACIPDDPRSASQYETTDPRGVEEEYRMHMTFGTGSAFDDFVTRLVTTKYFAYKEYQFETQPITRPIVDVAGTRQRDANARAMNRNMILGLEQSIKVLKATIASDTADLDTCNADIEAYQERADLLDEIQGHLVAQNVALGAGLPDVSVGSWSAEATSWMATVPNQVTWDSQYDDLMDAGTIAKNFLPVRAALAARLTASIDVARDELADAETELLAAKAFAPDPKPLMRPAGTISYLWSPAIVYTAASGAMQEVSLRLRSRYDRQDKYGGTYVDTTAAAGDIFSNLAPVMAAAALALFAPERYVDLSKFASFAPLSHKWFWENCSRQ